MRSDLHAQPGPAGHGTARFDRNAALFVLALILATLATRLLVFPINEHLYGDAVSRTEMAEQWARSPHVIRSFGDGAAQFGPLHLYLVAAALQVFEREDASRLVSLLFGVLTVIPLFLLTRRYFGNRSATWSCLAFAVWGLHVGVSTTGGSEAVALFFMWAAFAALARGFETRAAGPFLLAALMMNLAGAVRYDAWMYIPLLAAVPALQWTNRAAGIRTSLLFALMCLPFPLWWMAGNAAAHGSAVYPLTYIDEFHRVWAETTPSGWPQVWLRAQGIGFWPAMALFTLTPGVAAFGMIGMATSWRQRPETRWLVAAATLPVIYYAFRTTVLFNFVPLGRFAVVQISLLLPFVVPGFEACAARWGSTSARRLAIISAVFAIVMPLGLGLYTWRSESVSARVLRPISPTSTNPKSLMTVASYVRTDVVERGHTLALDSDTTYLDLQIGFFGRATTDNTARMRWPDFRSRVERQPPDFVVLFEHGLLAHEPWVTLSAHTLMLGATEYDEVGGFDGPARIFRR